MNFARSYGGKAASYFDMVEAMMSGLTLPVVAGLLFPGMVGVKYRKELCTPSSQTLGFKPLVSVRDV